MIFPKGLWADNNNSSSSRCWLSEGRQGTRDARGAAGQGWGRTRTRRRKTIPFQRERGTLSVRPSVHSATTATTLIAAAVEFLRS